MPRYKYTQESGTDFKVVNPDKADGQEDTNQVRQVLDDLGNLLGHSKRDDLYPKDGTTGGILAIPYNALEGPRSSPPASPDEGDRYLDDGTNTYDGRERIRIYDGSGWKDEEHRTGENIPATFSEDSRWEAGAHQGITLSQDYVYTSDSSTIYKYNRSGVLQDSQATSGDWPVGASQINSLFYRNGILYVGCSNYNTEPRKGWILEYNAETLAYIATHSVWAHWQEGLAWHAGYWWLVNCDDTKIARYDSSWNYVDEFTLSGGAGEAHQSCEFIGRLLLTTGGGRTDFDIFYWNGSGFDFVVSLDITSILTTWSQDFAFDPTDVTKIWFNDRGTPNYAVEASIAFQFKPYHKLIIEARAWTPTITFGGASVGMTYTANSGLYTKIGRMVVVTGQILLSSKGTSVGSAKIEGLPFGCTNNAGAHSAISLLVNGISFASYPSGYVVKNTSQIHLYEVLEDGTATTLADTDFADTSSVTFSATYFTD